MTKVSNFITEVVARFKGDDAQVIAAQNERIAKSAFKQQLSSLEYEEITAESAVELATENYKNAIYPTVKITDPKQYLERITMEKETLDNAIERLENIKASIKFFTELKEETFK